MRSSFTGLIGLTLAALTACGRQQPRGVDVPGGSLVIATGADADAVLPPLIKTSVGKQVVDALFLPLAQNRNDVGLFGDEGYAPALAERWQWARDSLSITFFLDPRAKWHDQTPVRASDARYTLAAFRAPGVASDAVPAMVSIDSVSVVDSLTFTAWYGYRSATQFHDLVSNLTPIPEHVYGAIPFDSLPTAPLARLPVGTGKFRMATWLPNERIEVVADTTHWSGRPLLDRVIWRVIPTAVAQVRALVTGAADMVEVLRGPELATAQGDSTIRVNAWPSFAFAMTHFNLRDPAVPVRMHPIFGDPGVRRALSMAVDRTTLVANILDTLGVAMTSPFVSGHHIAGVTLAPFDTIGAAALLDSLGWRDTNGDNIRDKAGRPLAFSLSAPVSSPSRLRASEIMQAAFTRIGARVTLQHVQNAVMMADNGAGKFDATLMGYSGDPNPATLRQYWKSEQHGQGTNWGGYRNPAFDALIDSAARAADPDIARAQYTRAGRLLAADAPGIWIYELRSASGIHKRFRVATVRPDAWWANLDRWSVDPAQLKPRDRLGPGGPPR